MEKESKSLDDYIEAKGSSIWLFSLWLITYESPCCMVPWPLIWTIWWQNHWKYDQIKVDYDRNKPEWTKLINKHSEAEVKEQGTVAVSMLVDKELNENREIRKLNTRVDIQQE